VFGAVDDERIDRPGDEADDIAVLGDQVKQGLKRVAVVGQDRPEDVEAAGSRSQMLFF
jgi:hypothetical protein